MNRLFQSLSFMALLVLAVGFLFVKIFSVYPLKMAVSRQVSNFERQLEEAKKSLKGLETKEDYYKSEGYKERQARIKLNYKKRGEGVIFVYKNPENVEINSLDKSKNLQNWQKWLKYLFGR